MTNPETRRDTEVGFEDKKRDFFSKIALRVRDVLKMHNKAGLWGEKGTEEDWRNVTEHCLVMVARADVLAEKLGFSEELKKDLAMGVAAHDFYKKQEIRKTGSGELTVQAMEEAEKESEKTLRVNGFSERVVKISGSAALVSLREMSLILEKDNLSQEDEACLVMHYLDDISTGSEWTTPNALDGRIDKVEQNPKYKLLKDRGLYEQQRKIGHQVEDRLLELLIQRGVVEIKGPEELSQFIDNQIKNKIENN